MDLPPIAPRGLTDIPRSCFFEIASLLPPQDLLSLASTCHLIADTVNSDEAWRPKVEQWIAVQDPRCRILGASAVVVQGVLGTRTMRGTAEALTALKFWPEGIWHSSGDSIQGVRGMLAEVVQAPHDNSLVFQFLTPSSRERWPWPKKVLQWNSTPVFSLKVESRAGRVCEERAILSLFPHEGPSFYSLHELSRDGSIQTLSLFRRYRDGGELVEPIFKRVEAVSTPSTTLRDFPLCSPAPGFYYAVYGSHGIEVLQLSAATADAPAPPLCPIHSAPRLEAMKLTGDPNVPAGKFSFAVDVSQGVRAGHYDASRDDPFPGPGGGRPIFEYSENAVQLVDLEEMPVAAIFSGAAGQINRVPRRWEPEWKRATMVVYAHAGSEAAESMDEAVFGVIIEEEGEDFRHMIDFWRLRFP